MGMAWYKLALRKHVMRVDLHCHCGDEGDFNNENDLVTAIKSMITAAIVKGLDVIGIVSHAGPIIGWTARDIALQNDMDIWILPGEEYLCSDGFRLLAYFMKESLPPNMTLEQALALVKRGGGWTMAINLTKRQAQRLNKMAGSLVSPDAVEIFNSSTGGYSDVEVDYPKFISSAAKTPADMGKINVFTAINRGELERLGILPPREGEDFTPKYLQGQAPPSSVASVPSPVAGR